MGYYKTSYVFYGGQLPKNVYEDEFEDEFGFKIDYSKFSLISIGDYSGGDVTSFFCIRESVTKIDDHGETPGPAVEIKPANSKWKTELQNLFPDMHCSWYAGTHGG